MKTHESENEESKNSNQEESTERTKKLPDPDFPIEVVGGPADGEGRPKAGSPPGN